MTGVRVVSSTVFAQIIALEKDLHRNGPERFYTMPATQLAKVKAFLDSVDRTDRSEPFVIELTPQQRATLKSVMSEDTRDNPEAVQRFAGYRYCDGLDHLQAVVGTELVLRDILG